MSQGLAEPRSAAAASDGAIVAVPGPYPTTLSYTGRDDKAQYVARKYAPILRGGVLDVGCDTRRLRALIPCPDRYVGVDFRAPADVVLNLDRDELPGGRILPFDDRTFDTVVCTDVLEHLERCHRVFDELCRVSRDRVVVSLPNPLGNLLVEIFRGTFGRMKYYGLPVDPPGDRHRWFFGFEEAAEFLAVRGRRQGFEVEQLDAERVHGLYWRVGKEQRDALDSPNVQCGTTWCVLRRIEGKDGRT